MDTAAVKSYLKILSSYSDETLETFMPLIEQAVAAVTAQVKSGADLSDTRLVHLAALKALCMIESTDAAGDNVTSFTAGDVTVQKTKTAGQRAKEMLEEAKADCRDLLCDSAFAFMDV